MRHLPWAHKAEGHRKKNIMTKMLCYYYAFYLCVYLFTKITTMEAAGFCFVFAILADYEIMADGVEFFIVCLF